MTIEELRALVQSLLPVGYRFTPEASTGGNCTADIVEAPDGRELLLTDGDAQAPLTSDIMEYRGLVACYYGTDNEEDGYLTIEPEDMSPDNITTTVKAWLEGDPYRDQQ